MVFHKQEDRHLFMVIKNLSIRFPLSPPPKETKEDNIDILDKDVDQKYVLSPKILKQY